MPFNFVNTFEDGPIIIEPIVFKDDRGAFFEAYKKSDFVKLGINDDLVQVNHSVSHKNVLRGLHYQLNPYAQSKLVRVLQGVIWDVAVDIRKNSPTYKKWVSVELSVDNRKQFYIPKGFAHGFLVLSEMAEVVYYVNEEYSKEAERTIVWNDEILKINWPLQGNPVLSDKDKEAPLFQDAENNF